MKKKKNKLLLLFSICILLAIPSNLIAFNNDGSHHYTNSRFNIFQQSISGVVIDDNNMPLPGASVVLMGTTQGVVADFDGKFNIEASEGDVIMVSYIGYETKQITITDETELTVVLNISSSQLEEVVVTALGIKKEKRRIGYAVQEVDGESLQKAVAPNVVESLTGKVAGLTITNNNDFFSNSGIYLRGSKPLIVINGVPSPSTDMWNISSDDIESISVLKAASASALYGSQGLNGAVQITLKTGANAPRGTSVSVNSSTTFQGDFIRYPIPQNQYGPGNAGLYEFGTGAAGGGGINDFDYSIFGPKFDGRLLPQYDSPIDPDTGERIPTPWVSRASDNLGHFMETGIVSNNNVTVQTNGEKGNFIISNTYKHSKATVPGAKLDVNTTRIQGVLNITEDLSLDGSLQYNYQYASNLPRSNYGPHSPIYLLNIWGGTHFDIRDFKDYWVPGKEGVEQHWVENWRYNNLYALAHEWKRPYTKNDILGYLKLNYKLNDHLSAFARTSLNSWSRTQDQEIAVSIYDYSISDRGGRYRHSADNLFESNTDFLINYNNNFFNEEFTVDAGLGGNQRLYRYDDFYATTTQLIVPDVFKLSNSVDKVTPTSYKEKKGVYSGYATLDMAYKNQFYFGVTGRVDNSTTLPKGNNSFFYPSLYFSTVLTDVFSLPEAINFLKLRTAYAKVGGDLGNDRAGGTNGIYSAVNSYSTGDRLRNLPIASYPSVLDNPNLSPSFNTSYEYGIEGKFFNNRVGFDFSYFENNYGPEIFTQRFSETSGYDGIRLNGRTTQRKGMDFTVNLVPIRSDELNWSTIFNFSAYNDYLTSLPPLPDGSPQLQDGRTFVGDELYHYWYNEWERSPEGELVIQSNGAPKSTDVRLDQGSTQPDFTASIFNDISYKNLSLSFLFDGRFGGITYDAYERDLWRSGSHPDAIHPEREQSNIAYANGGDARTMLIPGVKIVSGELSYDPQGNIVEDTRVFEPNDIKAEYQTWASRYKGAWENVLIEKTFIKLREITLTYDMPTKWMEKSFLNSASISLVGRNLIYWTKDDDTFGDMDTYSLSTGDAGLQMPAQRTYGFNINFQF
ncbi:SusC/RagA family TonB-linked outer membrane protein [Arenibacter certesii]|uniref:SusC/RagA family TonB-linked outer membrane protein n=1 Tax=Arenibacter certesii TaxID=228955 RepID=A0A918MQG0_9FLAO|nr:SusC/RagA family TonB-linked outer membrane protein [Arenibacter certesii]GGW45990.1 SusC/RagA family TonB-linked outer membrane protein [Arenibacter certesii]